MSASVTILLEDLAEQLASAEDAGYSRALTNANLSDRQRWEMQQEHNRTHGTRVRLYVAQLRTEAAA